MHRNTDTTPAISAERIQLEEQNRQIRREKNKLKRSKQNEQYFNQQMCKSVSITESFTDSFTNSFNNSLDRQYSNPMVDPLYLIRCRRNMVIPMKITEHSIEAPGTSDPVKAPRQYSSQFSVISHPRHLHEGMHASAEKKATASGNGFGELPDGVTWVKAHVKGLGKEPQ